MWNKSGPEIIKIYSERREEIKNAKELDSAFISWKSAINQQAWCSIRQKFVDHGVALNNFSNQEEFTQALTSYIDTQMNDASGSSSKKAYKVFADTIWYSSIKPDWVPYLTSNNQLSEGNLGVIEAKIGQWQSSVGSSNMIWLYIIIAVVIIGIIVFVAKSKSSKNQSAKTEGA